MPSPALVTIASQIRNDPGMSPISSMHHPVPENPMLQAPSPMPTAKMLNTTMPLPAPIKHEDNQINKLSSPSNISQFTDNVQRHGHHVGKSTAGPVTQPMVSVPTSTIMQNPVALISKALTSPVSAPAQPKPKSIPPQMTTPPPPQMSSSGIQPQRPQSVQLPVTHVPVSSADTVNIQRPPSAHSHVQFQVMPGTPRDQPPKSQLLEPKLEPGKPGPEVKGKPYPPPHMGAPPFMIPGIQAGQRMPGPPGFPFIPHVDPRLMSPVSPRESQNHSKEGLRKPMTNPHAINPRDMSRPPSQGQMQPHFVGDMPRQPTSEALRQAHHQRDQSRQPGPVEQMRQIAELKRQSVSDVAADQLRQRAQADHIRQQLAAGEQIKSAEQQKRHLEEQLRREEQMRREEQIRHRPEIHHMQEHLQLQEAIHQGRSGERQREGEVLPHIIRPTDDPQNLVRREQIHRAEQRFADMRHGGMERTTDIQRIVNQKIESEVRQGRHPQSGPQPRMHAPSPDVAICVKTPPATSAANAFIAGVVVGHPSSLSPKTASPVGQVSKVGQCLLCC